MRIPAQRHDGGERQFRPLILVRVVLDLDFCRDRTKFHLGAQGSFVGGLDIGPTWIWERDLLSNGFSVTAFAGLFAYPYYTYTIRPIEPGISEEGIYGKFHTRVLLH